MKASLNVFGIFFRKLSISQKLIISYLFLGTVMLSLLYYFYYSTTKKAIINRTHNQLKSVMNLKKGWLESYFENQKVHIKHFTTYYSTQLAFSELNTCYERNGLDSKEYRNVDSLFGGSLNEFIHFNHFKNIWFVNKNGEVIFTSIKSGNLGRNIYDSTFYNPKLKEFFNYGWQKTVVGDLSYLSQLYTVPCLVIVVPMMINSEPLGHILVKLQMDEINGILAQRSGMGQTGESYVVDESYIMRSKSRFLEDVLGKRIVVTTLGVKLAKQYVSGEGQFPDYRGVEVLSCFSKLNIEGLNWVLLSEIDYEEAMMPAYELNKKMIVISFFVSLGLVLITFYLSGQISSPVKQMNEKIKLLAKGVLPSNEIESNSEDEIGQIAFSINQLVDALKKTASFAKEIGSGNFHSQFEPLSKEDLLGHSLLEMRDQLIILSDLVAQQNRIKTLSLIEGQENERRRISRELHDGVGQMLTALMFKIQELDLNNATVQATKKLLDETIQEVRRVSVNLVPSVLYDFGIEAAIKVLIKSIDLKIEFSFHKELHAIEPDLEKRICLYRITQEALQNIQKYAKTDHARIHIELLKSAIDLIIVDYGIGFDVESTTTSNIASHGLRNMKERANLVGGSFDIESQPLSGTKITVNIPL